VVSQSVKAVVLAGGLAHWLNSPKALLRFDGTPLVLRIVNSLLELPQVTKVAVVGSPEVLEVLPPSPKCVKVQAASELWTNTQLGISAVTPESDDYLLLCAADMPFATASSLEAFLDAAFETGADIVYLAVPLRSFQKLGLSEVRRTSARLREGVLTGGNLFLVRAKVLPNITAFAERAIRSRKSLWQLGQIAGWKLLSKWLLSLLPVVGGAFLVSVGELEKRAEELLGCRCKAVIAELPELAFDVDKPEDWQAAESLLVRS